MRLIDSHAHLDDMDASDIDLLIERAHAAGVGRVIAIGGNSPANSSVLELAEKHPDFIRAVIGLSRDQATQYSGAMQLDAVRALAEKGAVGIGETGLDYHYERDTAKEQRILFGDMLGVAREMRLPVVVHSRDAGDDTLAMLREHASAFDTDRIGVLHCFTGGPAFAEELVELGFYISFSGIITFPKAEDIRDAARVVPWDRILIETDSPYLAPVPFRGKTNEPAYVKQVAEALAEIRSTNYDETALKTTANAKRLFGT